MKNFTKVFLISSVMSGSFTTNAMDRWASEEDKENAFFCGIETPGEFYRQKETMDSFKSDIIDVDSFNFEELRKQQEALNSFRTSHTPERKDQIEDDAQSDKEMASLYGMSLPQYLKWKKEEEEEMASLKLINDLKLQEEVDRKERQLREEEETKRFIHQIKEEERNTALARQIEQEEQDADLARQFNAQATISLAPFIPYEASLKEQIAYKTWEYSQGENRPTLQKFIEMFKYLDAIRQGSDVHALDGYVFGEPTRIPTLLKVGRLYNVDNGNLPLAEVGRRMVQFVNDHKDFFAAYKYEDTPLNGNKVTLIINGDQVITFLNSHFRNMDNEIKSVLLNKTTYVPVLEARELWSRAWTLALNLYNQGDDTAIQTIFDQAVEGHLTRGGCIQGRIDRGFVGYVSLLAKAGVNLY